jgi:hypothetical protein
VNVSTPSALSRARAARFPWDYPAPACGQGGFDEDGLAWWQAEACEPYNGVKPNKHSLFVHRKEQAMTRLRRLRRLGLTAFVGVLVALPTTASAYPGVTLPSQRTTGNGPFTSLALTDFAIDPGKSILTP